MTFKVPYCRHSSFDVADLLFRYNVPVQISTDEKVKGRVNGSVEFLKQHLEKGEVVYG